MPLKLKPPRAGKTPYYQIRGTYLGKYVDRSAKAGNRALAQRLLKKIERDIEAGTFVDKAELTFAGAAAAYMKAGGERTYIKKLLEHFRDTPIKDIDQIAIDAAAEALYPQTSPATKNRQCYTPVSAVLRHVGIERTVRRPKGAQGNQRTEWLWPEQAFKIIEEGEKLDAEFGALLATLCYTGERVSEPLKEGVKWRLEESFCYIPDTKNADPRPVFLPSIVVEKLRALGPHWKGFRFKKSGHLYSLLRTAAIRAGVELPPGRAFHLFCHTFATWIRRYAGGDEATLLATRRWKDKKSVARYTHTIIDEEARRAEMLPTPERKAG